MRKPTFWFPTWSDTNQAVQLQKMARGLKFRVRKVEGLYSAQPRSDAIFLPEPCYMLLSCTLKDLQPLLFIQISADVLPLKCLRGECC